MNILRSEISSCKTEGIYIFNDKEDNEICLFIFQKLTQNQLDIVLPDQKGKQCESNYFIGIFRKGLDYLGKTEFKGIINIMQDIQMYDLHDSYQNISSKLNNLSENEYNKYKDFAIKYQLNLKKS